MTTVLFLCRRPPWPLTNGGRIRSHRLAEGLAREFDTVMLTMDHEPGSPDGRVGMGELRAALPDVEIRTVRGLGSSKRLDQLRGLPFAGSWNFSRYATDAFRGEIVRLARDRKVDLIHADDLGAALALPDRCAIEGGPFIAYSSHNIESRIVSGAAAAADGVVRRLFAAAEARKLRAEERRVWNSVDLNLAVSERDAAVMRSQTDTPVELCPNGTDRIDPAPMRLHRDERDPLRLLFVGSCAYGPYERGLSWFEQEVLPLVRDRFPVQFDVVGQPPRRPPTLPMVVHRGYVDEVDSWYAAADAVVVPVFEGSGTRLKLVEAAARGRPIVTTALGAEGLPLEPDRHFLHAESAAEFADQIGRVANDAASLVPMVDAACAAVQPLLWPSIAEQLCRRYRAAVGR